VNQLVSLFTELSCVLAVVIYRSSAVPSKNESFGVFAFVVGKSSSLCFVFR
jgi:hypothetical protein